jgi:uncharacterized protein (DUF302 family)
MPRHFLPSLFLCFCFVLPVVAASPAPKMDSSVIKMPLAQGVSMDDAVQSMKLRANELNFKLVGDLPLYKQLEAMGLHSKRLEIYQFCDARIAQQMLSYDINFAAYIPCRIALIQDEDGKPWLITFDLNQVIQGANLPPELKKLAVKVRDTIHSIMEAGANGEL